MQSLISTNGHPAAYGGARLSFPNDAGFIDSLTPAQQAYFLYRMRERQVDLQAAIRQLAVGLSAVTELHDAAVRGVGYMESSEGEH